MKLTWNDLTINFNHINSKTLTEDWIWLVGEHATPVIVSSIGDMFLSNRDGIYWLNVGEGTYEKVANDIAINTGDNNLISAPCLLIKIPTLFPKTNAIGIMIRDLRKATFSESLLS